MSVHTKYSYVLRVLIALDQFGNAIAGGDPDETISSRIGRRKKAGKLSWRTPLSMAIDIMLEKIDPGHCVRNIEKK